MSALPQGAADLLFSITDPRLEKSVTVEDLGEVYGMTATPDGNEIFVIGQYGVAVYNRDLTLLGSYRLSTVLEIQKYGTDRGVEDWQYSVSSSGLTRLYGPRSGRELLLLPGGTLSFRKIGDEVYSIIPNGASENITPFSVDYDSTTGQLTINSTTFAGFPGPVNPPEYAVFGYSPADYDQLMVAVTREKLDSGKGTASRVVALGLINDPASAPILGGSYTLRIPLLPDDYIPVRAYVLGTMVYLCYGDHYSDLGSANYSFCAYSTSGPLSEPLAIFSGRGIYPVPIAGGVALLAIANHGKSVSLHRMRLVP